MYGIEIIQVSRKIREADGNHKDLFKNFDLTVGTNEIVGIMGANGCGKTTLLNLVAGILQPDAGEVKVWGKSPSQQRIAYIFQNYRESLFPWLSVKENILFPLSVKRISKQQQTGKLESLIALLSPSFGLGKYPYQLSGGQQQYVALMRSLISGPSIMLFDEPFSALDYENTLWLMEKIKDILEKTNIPALIVAHERRQLEYLAHRTCVLSGCPVEISDEAMVRSAPARKRYPRNDSSQRLWKPEPVSEAKKEVYRVRHT